MISETFTESSLHRGYYDARTEIWFVVSKVS